MILCRVEGTAVSTIHHPSLRGWRQLVCQPLNEAGEAVGDPVLVADALGAGLHQTVMVTSDGKTVRERVGDNHSPMRYLCIGIIDDPAAAAEEKEAVA